jgi:hypothetical protein
LPPASDRRGDEYLMQCQFSFSSRYLNAIAPWLDVGFSGRSARLLIYDALPRLGFPQSKTCHNFVGWQDPIHWY